MAAWVQPSDISQSLQAKRSRVMVEKVLTVVLGLLTGLACCQADRARFFCGHQGHNIFQ